MKVYTAIGQPEGNRAVQDVIDMDDALVEVGLSKEQYLTTIHSEGAHSE